MASSQCNPKTNADNVGIPDLDLVLEQDAIRAEDLWQTGRFKLAEALPTILLVRAKYRHHKRGSLVFRGCRFWGQYCRERLHCTPDAVDMAEKRMNLKQVPDEKAKAAQRERRAEKQNEKLNKKVGEWGRGLEFARAQNKKWFEEHLPDDVASPPVYDTESEDAAPADDDMGERVVPETALVQALTALDEANAMIIRIMTSGAVTSKPSLLTAARKVVERTCGVATDIRSEFSVDDPETQAKTMAREGIGTLSAFFQETPGRPKVVSIKDTQ